MIIKLQIRIQKNAEIFADWAGKKSFPNKDHWNSRSFQVTIRLPKTMNKTSIN